MNKQLHQGLPIDVQRIISKDRQDLIIVTSVNVSLTSRVNYGMLQMAMDPHRAEHALFDSSCLSLNRMFYGRAIRAINEVTCDLMRDPRRAWDDYQFALDCKAKLLASLTCS